MRSRGRARLFLALAAPALAGGLFAVRAAQLSPDTDVTSLEVPLTVNVYTEERTSGTTVEIEVTDRRADVYIAQATPTPTVVTSTLQEDDSDGRDTRLTPTGNGREPFLTVFPGGAGGRWSAPERTRSAVGTFLLPDGFTRGDASVFASRLPAAGVTGAVADTFPGAGSVGELSSEDTSNVSLDVYPEDYDTPGKRTAPENYPMPGTGRRATNLYWQPEDLAVTVKYSYGSLGMSDVLATGQVRWSRPSGGTLEEGFLAWHGGAGLSPEMSFEASGRSEGRTRWAFLSGLLLATAASSLLALAQELDDDWVFPSFRLRRARPSAGGAPGGEHTTATALSRAPADEPDRRRPVRLVAAGVAAGAAVLLAWRRRRRH